jgi:thiol-disulfide isomerase/thioredoxin
MATVSSYRVLIAGILSPPAAAFFGMRVYRILTRASADPDKDFLFRLSLTALAMAVPFLVTLALAIGDRRRRALTTSGRIGLALALASLALTWLPIRGAIDRARQTRNLALQGVTAPPFDTVDVFGKPHRLQDHAGEVVLVNVWATWCGPCKREMPKLDRLYQARKGEGFMVFGLSAENVEEQRRFDQEKVSVSYPLLTTAGKVPDMYRNTAQFPANFLIDRAGRLQPAPGAGEPFEKLEAAVDSLLKPAR